MAEPFPTFVPAGYRLLRELGSGRTGFVFLAGRGERERVALKLPRPELADRPELRRMFENEVQITMGLRHPNVVQGIEGNPTGKEAFLALEFCVGGTLADLLVTQEELPLDRARQLVVDVARGLEHVHGKQVLHRDVKPANVFLTREGVAKLGDFGTGIHIGDDSDERVGTAFYMAPEVFEGKLPDVRSDVYSLGVLAYEVIAGMRPFSGDSYEDLMMAHLTGLPKGLVHHRKEVSRGEARVIAMAMARQSENRYPTVRAFREAFSKAAGIEDSGSEAHATGRASRKAQPKPDESNGDQGRRSGGLFGWFRRKREN